MEKFKEILKAAENSSSLVSELEKIERKLDTLKKIELTNNFEDNKLVYQLQLKDLISSVSNIKELYPKEFDVIINNNNEEYSFFKSMNILSEDINKGYKLFLKFIKEDIDETLVGLVNLLKTNEIFTWVGSNPTRKVKLNAQNISNELSLNDIIKYCLPKIKAEQLGDLLCLAEAGILSKEFSNIKNQKSEEAKINHIKKLMEDNRLYINFNFNNKTITNNSNINKGDFPEYDISSFRRQASARYVDCAYANHVDKKIYMAVCTSDFDVEKQKEQLFELIHLNKNCSCTVDGQEYEKDVKFITKAFFCTEKNQEDSSFHHSSQRYMFENTNRNINEDEMNFINALPILSLLGNSNYPRFPHTYEPSDLVDCNPFVIGADTHWLLKEFKIIRQKSEPEKTQLFFNFLLNYANDCIDILNKIEENITSSEQNNLIVSMKDAYELLLKGIINDNFTSYNLKREYSDQEKKLMSQIEEKINTFNDKQPNTKIDITLQSSLENIVNSVKDKKGERIFNRMQKNSERLNYKGNEKNTLLFELESALESDLINSKLKKLDIIVGDMYKGERALQEKTLISSSLKEAIKVAHLMIKYDCCYSDVINRKIEIIENFSSGFYFNYLINNSNKSRQLNNNLKKVSNEKQIEWINIDKHVKGLFDLLSTKDGVKTFVSKGVEKTINDILIQLDPKIEKTNGFKY